MGWFVEPTKLLSDEQFKKWRDLIEERTGVQLPERQRSFLQIQLSSRMREFEVDGYDAYYSCVTNGVGGALEWAQLIDRLVIKETQFFRHRPSLDFVREYIQQKLIVDRDRDRESIEIWSVGCSTGEEPYSLAMVASDCFSEAGLPPYFGVTALDISAPALQLGRLGIYAERKVELLSAQERERYMAQLEDKRWQVVPELRQRICFSLGNLLQLKAIPVVKMDVIYCQNLLIYFRRWRRREILNELVSRLKPGGLLVIGAGEALHWQHPQMQPVLGIDAQAYIASPK